MKKKFLALSLAAAMCFSLAGCAVDISLPGKSAKDAGEGVDFMPLQVEYKENSRQPAVSPAVSLNAKAVHRTTKY